MHFAEGMGCKYRGGTDSVSQTPLSETKKR
jgi:hypothetical protein